MNKNTLDKALLSYKSFSWTPKYMEPSAWIEHVPFAFWLIENSTPQTVVELGVYNGTSYFSFCEAIERLNLNAKTYGVDTWVGDEHAGFYSEEVYNKVHNYNGSNYSKFSTLIRSTFDEAKQYFTKGTIDLLHIDGLHTYEAVKHDFENWLPLLSENAIVVFHDTNVRERDFGVFQFWEELKTQYRHFEFDFGFGLGILAIGKKYAPVLDSLFEENKNSGYYNFLRNLFGDRGHHFKTKLEFGLQKYEADHQRSSVNILSAENALLKDQLQAKEAELSQSTIQLNAVLQELDALTALKIRHEEELVSLQHSSVDSQNRLAELTGSIVEFNNKIVDLQAQLETISVESSNDKAVLKSLEEKQIHLLEVNAHLMKQSQLQDQMIEQKDALNLETLKELTLRKEDLIQCQSTISLLDQKAKSFSEKLEQLERENEQLQRKVEFNKKEISEALSLTEVLNKEKGHLIAGFKEKEKGLISEKDEWKRQFEELQREFNEYKNVQDKNNEELVFLLQNQVNTYKKYMEWYQRTYEKRTILGLVKDRIFKKS